MTAEEFKRAHFEMTRPFDASKLHWRVGATTKDKSKGIALAYLNARDVMQRLDGLGLGAWKCTYPMPGFCELSIKIEGEWITRTNAAGETDVEAEKGMASDAFKRAAVLWGIGRYLYYLPNDWVPIKPQGRSHVIAQTPKLPAFALPENWHDNYWRLFSQDRPQQCAEPQQQEPAPQQPQQAPPQQYQQQAPQVDAVQPADTHAEYKERAEQLVQVNQALIEADPATKTWLDACMADGFYKDVFNHITNLTQGTQSNG